MLWIISCLALLLSQSVFGQPGIPSMPARNVEDNVLTSSALPEIRVKVDDSFSYIGKFDFVLKEMAYGERYVFVEANGNKITRLFIFQFEGYLPDNALTYNYDFTRAEPIGGYRFRQNTWAYSNRESQKKNPGGEGALTAEFLRNRGFEIEDELMMSRFLMVPDEERRHELILFYLENARTTGHKIASFYDASDTPTPHWKQISEGLTERSRASFVIIE